MRDGQSSVRWVYYSVSQTHRISRNSRVIEVQRGQVRNTDLALKFNQTIMMLAWGTKFHNNKNNSLYPCTDDACMMMWAILWYRLHAYHTFYDLVFQSRIFTSNYFLTNKRGNKPIDEAPFRSSWVNMDAKIYGTGQETPSLMIKPSQCTGLIWQYSAPLCPTPLPNAHKTIQAATVWGILTPRIRDSCSCSCSYSSVTKKTG